MKVLLSKNAMNAIARTGLKNNSNRMIGSILMNNNYCTVRPSLLMNDTYKQQYRQYPRYNSSTNDLAEILSNELIAEKSDDNIDVELVDITNQIQKTFKINDQTGLGIVTLERKFKGESIEIVFDCQDEVDDDEDALGEYMDDVMNEDDEKKDEDDEGEEEEEESFIGINFNVIITKGKEKMLVNCVASKNLKIENAQFIPAGKEIDDDNLYGGPLFYQLDESLQESFKSYLSDRKIDEDLCYFILAYSRSKEQKEYVNWLENMLDFTDQSSKKLPPKP